MDERTEEERATRTPLTVMVGGAPRELRILKRSESRVWKRHVAERIGVLISEDATGEQLLALGGLSGLTDELLADLVLSYDVDDVMGGPVALDEMTDQELLDAYRAMVRVTLPKDNVLGEMMQTFGTLVPSLKPNSGNGHSRNGRRSGRKDLTASLTSS